MFTWIYEAMKLIYYAFPHGIFYTSHLTRKEALFTIQRKIGQAQEADKVENFFTNLFGREKNVIIISREFLHMK